MTNAKLILVTAAVLLAGLINAGAGVMGNSASLPENPLPAIAPQTEASQPAKAPPAPQGPGDSVTVTGVVVDPEGMPVSDVEVVLTASRLGDISNPSLARSMTDDRGAFRLEVTRQPPPGIGTRQLIWAHHPGRSLAIQVADLTGNGAINPVRLTLAKPFNRTLTILDDDRPVAGVRLAPVFYTINDRSVYFTPDDQIERLTVVTGADGMATLPYLPAAIDPINLRVTAPGIVAHELPLLHRPGSDRFTLKLGRPARLTGSVYHDSGQPAANVPVEVRVQNWLYDRSNPDGNRLVGNLSGPIRFDSGPIRTQSDGSFQTPPQLMTGSTYRVVINPETGPPASSDLLLSRIETTNVPPFRLRQVRKLVGRVEDRGGKPVAGARVFLPSGEPSTTTDAQGRFVLEGSLPDRTYLLVRAEGFRFQGWPAIPARQAEERKHILARTNEPPGRMMTPLPAPISLEESRALARGVFDPYLRAALEKGDDSSKRYTLSILSKIDPAEALDLLEKHALGNGNLADQVRMSGASNRIVTDPVGAVTIVEAIATPGRRGLGYQRLAAALPASERDRKRTLLDRATRRAHAEAEAADNIQDRIYEWGEIADSWLNLGEVEKGRELVLEAFRLLEMIPPPRRSLNINFFATAARIDLERVLSIVKEATRPDYRRAGLIAVAKSLANEKPAEAERVFRFFENEGSESRFARLKSMLVMQLCHRMAKVDPGRVRRILAGLNEPADQACAWALLAIGRADRDKSAARSALNESIQIIDRLLDTARPSERLLLPSNATNPAASILPIVEKVAPERVEEIFWRTVALVPKTDLDRIRLGVPDARAAVAAVFLARYDRQVAAAMAPQVDQVLRSPPRGSRGHLLYFIWAKAAIDPRSAVAMIEAMPPGGPDRTHPTNQDRLELASLLAEPPEDLWKHAWSYFGVEFD